MQNNSKYPCKTCMYHKFFKKNPDGTIEHYFTKDEEMALDLAIQTLEERPQGEWIKWNFKTFGAFGDWEYKCSKCEKVYGGEYNFCPNCGADMRGDKNETN